MNLSWLSTSLATLYSADNPTALAEAGIAMVHHRFGASLTGLQEVGHDLSRYRVFGVKGGEDLPPDFTAYIHDHPAVLPFANGKTPPVWQLSRDTPARLWERTDHFQGIGRPMNWQDQLAILSHGSHSFACWDIWRDRPFTDRERQFADLLQIHFDAAWKRMEVSFSHARPPEAAWITLPSKSGFRNIHLPTQPHSLLRAYFPGRRPATDLPAEVVRWIEHSRRQLERAPLVRPLRAIRVDSARGRLHLRYYPGSERMPSRIKLVERLAVPDFFELRTFGMTSRECEVVHWLSEGKRDSEIARILACATTTVSKHVERILKKLHVETRTAAAHAAHRLLLARNLR